MNTTLTKKTKAEIISAYEELLAKNKELTTTTQQSYAPERTKTLEQAKGSYTTDAIEKTVATLHDASRGAITDFARAFEEQVRQFEQLQKAAALIEERLKVLRELEAGAEMGTQLIIALESERAQLENEIATKRRDWEREQEEAEYRAKTDRTRVENQAAEERKKKELLIKEREQVVAAGEKELAEQVKRLENYESDVEKEASKRVADAKKEWEAAHVAELAEKDRAIELEEKLHGIKTKELLDDVKRLESEVASLRKDAAEANKRGQDLALKIVEGTAREHALVSAHKSASGPV